MLKLLAVNIILFQFNINKMDIVQRRKYRLATRNSQLAMVQTHEIIALLTSVKELNLTKDDFEIIEVKTAIGDVNQSQPLHQMGGIGVFTKSVEIEL